MDERGGFIEKGQWYRSIFSLIPAAGFAIAVLAALLAAMAGPGSRFGLWHFRTGFSLLKWAAYGGAASIAVSLAGLITRLRTKTGFPVLSAVGALLGFAVFFVPLMWWYTAKTVPPIHDITTDTENPPEFVAVVPLRAGSPNSTEYGGVEVAEEQGLAYPYIRPLVLKLPVDEAFKKALGAAGKMGWEIVAAEPGEGRIEAIDTTFWFGFKDDIVIRITPLEGAALVDVRSLSRVGRSDVGTNARRIRKYLKVLDSMQP